LTNRLPFTGQTAEDMRAAIIKDKPSPLPADIPERLKWIVAKALRKDREERYQTIREIFSDLREFHQELTNDLSRIDSGSRTGRGVASTAAERAAVPADSITKRIAAPTSSAEYVLTELSRHKRGVLISAAGLLVVIAGLAYGLVALWRHQQPKSR